MIIPFYQVDAFTDRVFSGNPAAVCPLTEWLPDEVLLQIAAENNLSETAFFVKEDEGYHIRWFTPRMEVDLCGHATLASAHVIFNFLDYRERTISFSSASGALSVFRKADLIYLNFPSRPPVEITSPAALIEGLGKKPLAVFKSRDYYAVYQTEAEIRQIQPNLDAFMELDALGVCITAPGNDCDFVSRFFAPRAGVDEDPVTGSAHSSLIPYWSHRLKKEKLHARQLSQRGGELFCEDRGERVLIGGKAITVIQGNFQLPEG